MSNFAENDYLQADGHTFEKQYKEVLSGFRDWDQLEHADKWLLFPDNIVQESPLMNPHCPTGNCIRL